MTTGQQKENILSQEDGLVVESLTDSICPLGQGQSLQHLCQLDPNRSILEDSRNPRKSVLPDSEKLGTTSTY